ncbi:MAG: S8 family serine peptidase [Cyclobacteriaceae bacterium]
MSVFKNIFVQTPESERVLHLRLIILLLLLPALAIARQPAANGHAYAPDRIVVRLAKETSDSRTLNSRTGKTGDIISIIRRQTGALSIDQPVDYATGSKGTNTATRSASHALSNIYIIEVPTGSDIRVLTQMTQALPGVLYAEPYPLPQPLYIPDDPEAVPGNRQDYLAPIQAYRAWDVEKGNPEITIGILDTGVRYSHPDLAGNMAFNSADSPNGLDDDGDGLIDNYRGWDWANEDNDPDDTGPSQHGTAVAGLAAGVPDNGVGIAGTGFNSSFLPVKIYTDGEYNFKNGYEAIAYAADAGCEIINLSWGGQGNYSQFVQDIIDYAVLDHDAVIIAAAGNTDGDLEFFPAAYDRVLSVGAVDVEDKRAPWATYHPSVDMVAPGLLNYTTYKDDSYASFWGSSFATPLVSGAAALIRSHYPDMSALEVMEQLRVTSDDIYYLPENTPYEGYMGKGRLNMYRALTETNTPSVRGEDFTLSGPHNAYIFPGDSATLSARFVNYLADASLLRITVSSLTEGVTIEDEFVRVGDLARGESYDSKESPFRIKIPDDLENGSAITLRIDYEGVNYRDFQLFRFKLVDDPIFMHNGFLGTSFGKKGEIAYQENWEGQGITHDDDVIAFHSGVVMASGSGQEADNITSNFLSWKRNADFTNRTNYELYRNSFIEPDLRLEWTEDKNWGLLVEQKVYADTSSALFPGYFLVEYRIINRSDSLISDFHFGLYTDFQLEDAFENRVASMDSLNLQYTASENLMAGWALAGGGEWNPQAIVVRNADYDRIDVPTFFNREDKHELLTRETPRYEAGSEEQGYDMAQMAGVRLGDLGPYESRKVTFVLATATSEVLLAQKVKEAFDISEKLTVNPPEGLRAGTCPDLPVSVTPPGGQNFRYYSDPAGTELVAEGPAYTSPGISRDTTIYYRQADSLWLGPVAALELYMTDLAASFDVDTDTLMLDENGPVTLKLSNTSREATAYYWDFGNGYYSTNTSPSPIYSETGTYTVTLNASVAGGCSDMAERKIVAVRKNDKPLLTDQFSICPGVQIDLEATNSSLLRIYTSYPGTSPVAESAAFTSGALYRDTVFYVTNADGPYESNPVEVTVDVEELSAAFTLIPDTTSSVSGAAAWLVATQESAQLTWYRNGTYLAQGSRVLVDLEGVDRLDLRLEAENSIGCAASADTVINLRPSPTPVLSGVAVCPGEEVVLQPEGGRYFAFYTNTEGTHLAGKGRSLNLGNVYTDTLIYVAGLDSLLLSDLVPVAVTTEAPAATFTYTADSVNSWGIRDIYFTPDFVEGSSYHWDFGDGTTSEETTPVHFFENPGSYIVALTVTGPGGCISSYSEELILSAITSLPEDLPGQAVRLYPNPASDAWSLDFGNVAATEITVSLYSATGHLLRRITVRGGGVTRFERQGLPPGVYHLQYQGKNAQGTLKLMLR